MKKILLVETILNGIVKIIKAIKCKSSCCIQSSCNQPDDNLEEKINKKIIYQTDI
jgi:hypothetical protein